MSDPISEAVARLLALHGSDLTPPPDWRARNITTAPEGD